MALDSFPSQITQLLEGNNFQYKDAALVSANSFIDSRKINYTDTHINVNINIQNSDLVEFENFYHLMKSNGNRSFYWTELYFSEYETSDKIFRFIGGYKATHISKNRFSITFQLQLVQ